MPLLIMTLVAIGLRATAFLAPRGQRAAVGPQRTRVDAALRPVGAKRPRLVGRVASGSATRQQAG